MPTDIPYPNYLLVYFWQLFLQKSIYIWVYLLNNMFFFLLSKKANLAFFSLGQRKADSSWNKNEEHTYLRFHLNWFMYLKVSTSQKMNRPVWEKSSPTSIMRQAVLVHPCLALPAHLWLPPGSRRGMAWCTPQLRNCPNKGWKQHLIPAWGTQDWAHHLSATLCWVGWLYALQPGSSKALPLQ